MGKKNIALLRAEAKETVVLFLGVSEYKNPELGRVLVKMPPPDVKGKTLPKNEGRQRR